MGGRQPHFPEGVLPARVQISKPKHPQNIFWSRSEGGGNLRFGEIAQMLLDVLYRKRKINHPLRVLAVSLGNALSKIRTPGQIMNKAFAEPLSLAKPLRPLLFNLRLAQISHHCTHIDISSKDKVLVFQVFSPSMMNGISLEFT
jgi:hypothetical protein